MAVGQQAARWGLAGLMLCLGWASTAWSQPAVRPTGDPTNSAAPSAGSPVLTRHSDFAIPYQVNDPVVTPEVQLMVSRDRGGNWVGYDRQPAQAGRFRFQADSDGEYWFAVRTFNTSGRPTDAGSFWQPELKVVVDTQVPAVTLDVEVLSSGEVIAKWSVRDPSLDESNIYLSYQASPQGPFQQVELSPEKAHRQQGAITGETRWRPTATDRTILVRLDAYDQAGNVGAMQKTVGLPLVAQKPAWNQFPRQPGGEPQDTASAFPVERASPQDPFARGRHGAAPQPIAWPQDNGRGQAATTAGAAEQSGLPPLPGVHHPSSPLGQQAQSTWTAAGGSSPSRQESEIPSGAGTQGPGRFEAASMKMEPPVAGPSPKPEPPRKSAVGLPPGVRPSMTNQKRFALNYSLDAVGPSGVGQVELWVTHDGGKSWEPGGIDPDRQSPFDVEVQNEGNYGFRIVVEGGNGLIGRRPQAGDLADIWVCVDTTKPVVTITSVVYGEGHRAGQLDISWTAHDANLAEAPISLYYGASVSGPWKLIAENVENTGLYTWKVSPEVPPDIFLRIVAEDEAGNEGENILSRPIENDGLVPQAKIRSVEPLPPKTSQSKLPLSIR